MMKTIKKRNLLSKRGVSPVVATIVLVAVTLVAAVSVGGYISGLFGGFTSGQTLSAATYFGGASPVLTITVSNSGDDVNITSITVSGPGITGVYQYDTVDPGLNYPVATNGASSHTFQAATVPTFNPGTGTNAGTTYSVIISFANGRSATQSLVAQ